MVEQSKFKPRTQTYPSRFRKRAYCPIYSNTDHNVRILGANVLAVPRAADVLTLLFLAGSRNICHELPVITRSTMRLACFYVSLSDTRICNYCTCILHRIYTVSRKSGPLSKVGPTVTLIRQNRNRWKLQRAHWHPFEHCVLNCKWVQFQDRDIIC